MTKQEYIETLTRALKTNKIKEIDEIISEYEDHFDFKIADGYSEEEVAAKLEKPEIIAAQFVYDGSESSKTGKRRGGSIISKIGVCLLDIVMIMLGIVLYSFVIVLGAAAIGLLASGIYMIIGGGIAALPLPMMSAAGRILMSISILALAVVTTVGMIYYALFVTQLARAYCHWHKNMMTGRISPALSTTPKLSGKRKRRLRMTTRVALLIFIITFIIAFVIMSISAGSLGFWHIWHWLD